MNATIIDEWLAEQRRLTPIERFASKHDAGDVPAQARYYRELIPANLPQPGQQYRFEIDLWPTAWRFAAWPTRRSPLSVKATTDGVIRLPSALVSTRGSPASMMETHEFVVPRSIPITLAMARFSFRAL